MPTRHRVVVVGGGFGGLQAVRHLKHAAVDVTLIDRRNFHLFEPLVYQVATGALSPGEIATPLRAIFKRHHNVRVLMAEIEDFDLARREVVLALPDGADGAVRRVPYDTLIVSAGSQYSYFGHDDWRPFAPEVKTLESALDVRARILAAFEAAELEPDPGRRAAWLTFAVVGAGPTGVELAGQIAEIARDTLRRDFRAADPRQARILLVDEGDRVLASYPPSLSAKAEQALVQLGVTPLTRRRVVDVDGGAVTVQSTDGERERIPARTVLWAAGVVASPLARALADASGAATDRAGRVLVEPDLALPGHPEVLAIGDMVAVRGGDGEPLALPGVAPVAMQQGKSAARVVRRRVQGRATGPFRYLDKGDVATIGRARAVASLPGRVRLSGAPAWVFWAGLHLFYLIGFENRLLVLTRWAISFVTRGRGARLITRGTEPPPGTAVAAPARSSTASRRPGSSRRGPSAARPTVA